MQCQRFGGKNPKNKLWAYQSEEKVTWKWKHGNGNIHPSAICNRSSSSAVVGWREVQQAKRSGRWKDLCEAMGEMNANINPVANCIHTQLKNYLLTHKIETLSYMQLKHTHTHYSYSSVTAHSLSVSHRVTEVLHHRVSQLGDVQSQLKHYLATWISLEHHSLSRYLRLITQMVFLLA